jgi:acetyl-CoA acetyltransferase
MDKVEELAAITGTGRSAVGRHLHADPWSLTADAALAAIADAGLEPSDIDGLSTYPGAFWSTPGITGAGVDDVRAMLGLDLRWYAGGGEVPGQLGSVVNAVLAVGSGLASHVLCFRTVWESTAQDGYGSRSSALLGGGGSAGQPVKFGRELQQWTVPFGIGYPCYAGLEMRRYMELAGATREQFAQVAVVARRYAADNAAAVYRAPLTVGEYLSARMISDPACIYDCDVPVDGSVAFVVSRVGSAPSGGAAGPRPVRIEAIGSASGLDQAAAMLWSRTSLGPADVDVAQLYDGFSVYALLWLEALGFCGQYEAAAFVEGGHRIGPAGELPLNTNGGQLSAGRLHGYGGLLEACTQLRGEAGPRQLPRRPEVAVVSSGAASFTSCLLLTC